MKNKLNIIVIFCVLVLSCNKEKYMNNKTDFNWGTSVTSVKDYPIEVYKGFLATNDKFITALHSAGTEDSGWDVDGQELGGGNVIPTNLSLTWVSYTEKKFWKIETTIDQTTQNKIISFFRQGFYNWDNVKNESKHETYNHITIAVAPGGIVVLFLTGSAHRIEVASYQAKETFVDVNVFYDNPHEHTQQQFYDTLYGITVPKNLQEKIDKSGIPYGIWDNYREKYSWIFQPFFYKDDALTDLYVTYINGEEDYFDKEELDKKKFNPVALPFNITFYFKIYNGEAKFDEEEIVAVFKKMKKNHHGKNIEIEMRPAFMYKTTTFTVKCEDEEIPLEKVNVKMWKN